MKLRTTLTGAALIAAIATSWISVASAVTWNSGNANWVAGTPGWNGAAPNSVGALAEFTGITSTSTATVISPPVATIVGNVLYGPTGSGNFTATIAGTSLTLNNGGSGVTIINSNADIGTSNRLVISAPLIFGNPADSVTVSNQSGSALVSANGPVAINGAVSGTVNKLTLESNSLSASTRFVGANTIVATNGILYRKGYIATALSGTAIGGNVNNVVTIGESGQGDVFLSSGNSGTVANSVIIAGATGEFRGYSISNVNTITFSGPITLNGTFSLGSGSTGTNSVSLTNGITGVGGLTINPARPAGSAVTDVFHLSGAVKLSAANTFTGDTFVNRGTLNLSHPLAVQDSTVAVSSETLFSNTGPNVNAGAFVQANLVFSNTVAGNAFTFGGLSGSGNIALQNDAGSPAAIALSVGNNNTDTSYSGNLSASGSLVKIGSGVTTLSNVNAYAGATAINNGILQISSGGSINATSGITINGGELKYNSNVGLSKPITFTLGTISGTGAIDVPVTVGSSATLSPGNSPGAQAYGSGLTWTGSGDYNWQILDVTGAAGSGYDVLNVTGTLDLSGASGFDLNLWSLSSIGPDVNGDAINWDNTIPHSWILATTTGGVSGFDALNFNINVGANNGAGGFSNDLGGGSFSLSLTNGGNDLVLNFMPIPEPNALIIASIGVVGLGIHRRRRADQR